MQTKDEQLIRRDFLKAATVSGLGLSAIAMLGSGCRASPAPTPVEEEKPTSTVPATEEPTKAPTPTEATEEETLNLKTVAMTGYVLMEDLRELKEEGSLEVVYKPLNRNTLAQIVRRALDGG